MPAAGSRVDVRSRATARWRTRDVRSALLALCALLLAAFSAQAQDADPQIDSQIDPQFAELVDRPISAVRFEGLKRVTQQEVLNNIRSAIGQPFDPAAVKADVARLTRLGQFRNIEARAELSLGSLLELPAPIAIRDIAHTAHITCSLRLLISLFNRARVR